MKITFLKLAAVISFFLLISTGTFAQSDSDRAAWVATLFERGAKPSAEAMRRVARFDLGPLWARVNDNDSVLGYIGGNYQRLRLVILSANKRADDPATYNVTGKSMVNNVVRAFNGTMKITRASSTAASDLDEEYKSENIREAGVVVGEYHFAEDPKLTSTGTFDGTFATYWCVDKNGRLVYDEVMVGADGYSNNQFGGTWTSYRKKVSKPASWGDSRMPLSGDLDIGAGEFSPDEKYVRNGWQNYIDAYVKQNKRALAEERRQWWK
jgi:hypothetical protein